MPDILARFDRSLRMSPVSPRVAGVPRIPWERAAGRTHREIGLPEELCAAWEKPLAEAFATGSERTVEMTIEREPGSFRTYKVRLIPEPADDGKVVHVLAVGHDVTAERVAQAERDRLFDLERAARARAEEAERRSRLLAEASRLFSDSLDPEDTLQRLARIAVPDLADWCHVLLREADGTSRVVAAAVADPGKEAVLAALAERFGIPSRGDDPIQAALGGVPFLRQAIDPAHLGAWARDGEHLRLLEILDPGSTLMVPLTARGRTLGILAFTSTRASGRRYAEADQEFALELATRAALAVDNARLYRAEQAAREAAEGAASRMARLQSVMASLTEALAPADVVRIVLDQGVAALGAKAGSVAVPTPAGDEIRLLGAVGYAPELVAAFGALPVGAHHPLADAYREAQPIFLETAEAREARYPHLARARALNGAGAMASVPLLLHGHAMGVVGLNFAEDRPFSPDEREFVLALANQCAQALERGRLFEAVKASEARLRTVIEQSPLSIQLFSPDGRCTFANAAWERQWNDTRHSVLGYNILQDPQLEAMGVAPLVRKAFHGNPVRIPAVLYDPARLGYEGRPRWVETVMYPLTDEEGAMREVVLVHNDITEQKVAESALLVQKTLLESQNEAALDAILMVGREREWLFYNRRFIEMWALPPAVVAKGTSADAMPAILAAVADPEGFRERVEYLYQHPSETGRDEVLLKDGRILDRYTAPVTGPDGTYYGRVWFFRDVTARRRADQELEHARRQLAENEKLSALGTLVSGVAHEIRTPLTYVANNAFLARDSLEQAARADASAAEVAPAVRTALLAVEEGVERINRLVVELRRFMRGSQGERPLAPLHDIVRGGVALFEAAHRDRVRLALDLAPTPEVRVDRVQVQQILINLLLNAAEAMPTGGTVRVATRPLADGGAEVSVSDDGPGIPPPVQAHMFDEFFTTKPHGTGLGLSIVRRIVEEHGGSIRCESEPGRGATFRVAFPPP